MRTIKCKCGRDILFDDHLIEAASKLSWECLSSKGGQVRAKGGRLPASHFVMGQINVLEKFWDHVDRNQHNNQSSNFRVATRQQNNVNREAYGRSGLKGVRYLRCRYYARTTVNYKEIKLGSFATREEASRAYDQAALKYHGQFAVLNNI